MKHIRRGARRTTVVVAATTVGLLAMSGLAFAADLKADLSLATTGVQQNANVGDVVGGSTIILTDNLYLQGGPTRLTSATFDDDGDLPAWVSSVSGGTATKTATTVSTITVVAPCTLGSFGADGGSEKVAGSSVQYQVSAVNEGALLGDVGVGSAWVNIRGNVTSLGSTCNTDTANPTGSITIDDAAAWTNSSTGGVSLDLTAGDNVGIVKYRLAETAAGLATATDVAVSPAVTSFTSNVGFTLSGTEGASKDVWVRYFDAAGNSVDASDSIGWDTSAPVITDDSATNAPTGTQGSGNWWISAVTVTFKASDNLSGFTGKVNPYTFTQTTSSEGSAVTVSSGTVNDIAGNPSTAVSSAAFQIDLTNPAVACVTPAPTFVLGSAGQVSADVTDGGSGPTAATISDTADTSSVGTRSVTLTGFDNAGRSTSVSCGYNVIYDWTGFFRPVDNLPTLNSVKAGSAVPVKFNLGGNQGLDIMTPGYPKSQSIACDATALVDGVEETVTAGSSSLSYDSTASHYTYVWKTDKAWAGTCRQLVVTLNDGTVHRANFKLLK